MFFLSNVSITSQNLRLLSYFCRVLLFLTFSLAGCTSSPEFILMETPAIYHEAAVDPFAHLGDAERDTVVTVFYGTNRQPQDFEGKDLPYGNKQDEVLRLGKATLRFGDENYSWQDLYLASISPVRQEPVPITLQDVHEMGSLNETFRFADEGPLSAEQKAFVSEINAQLATAQDKEIMVYVHGTKVDFLNAVAITAEVDHFSGRDFVGVAFDWPSHQNILYYLFGIDVARAKNSSQALRAFLEFLARHTNADHINLLSYSAGGKVASKALYELRSAYPELDNEKLREKFRLGAVVFAATDVPLETFLQRLPAISDLSDQVVVTVSDHDPALLAAEKYMESGMRVGEETAEAVEMTFAEASGITNFEVIDLSLNQAGRGFNIIGHHYWYRHPWASSDIVLLLRTNLPPHLRGLSPAELEGVFYMSPDYPNQVREATRKELGRSWYRDPAGK